MSAGSLATLAEMSPKAQTKSSGLAVVSVAAVQARILVIREHQVMLDQDLAELYGVETGALTRAVRRNEERFPSDFMFQLTKDEYADLRSQIGISSGHGGRRYPPYVFTEQGVAMLSSVLRSGRAVAANIAIMRAFVEMRRAATNYKALETRIDDLEARTAGKLGEHEKHLVAIFKALRQLAAPVPPKRKHPLGFSPPENGKK
jgi:ORF6N domain